MTTLGKFATNAIFATGDVGFCDDSDFVTITGRIKEILITAGGENVAPIAIEAELPDKEIV